MHLVDCDSYETVKATRANTYIQIVSVHNFIVRVVFIINVIINTSLYIKYCIYHLRKLKLNSKIEID